MVMSKTALDKKLIIVVDDNRANRSLITSAISDVYHVKEFDSAEHCIEYIDVEKPAASAFLLDVHMPEGMNGFDLCRKIRAYQEFQYTPVVFLSALDSLESKTKGYNAGADDYLTKPVILEELLEKLTVNIRKYETTVDAYRQAKDALATAMTAMRNGSEIGEVNKFFEKVHDCSTFESLADEFLESLRQFGLDGIVYLNNNIEPIIKGSISEPSPLEIDLLSVALEAKRITDFGKRSIFNFQSALLLIKNMPVEDEEKYGRYKDHICSLMNGLDSRIRSLSAELTLRGRHEDTILKALAETNDVLDDVMEQFKLHDEKTRQILDNLMTDMNVAFSYLNLSDEDEEYLIQLLDRSMGQLVALYTNSIDLDRKFEHIVASLDDILQTANINR